MNSLDELSQLWQAKETKLPSSEELQKKIADFGRKRLRNKRQVIMSSALLSLLVLCILFIGGFELPSTYAGGALIVLLGLFLCYSSIRSYGRFAGMENLSVAEFLAFMEKTQQNVQRFYHVTQRWLFALAFSGLSLYLYEAMLRDFWTGAILYLMSASALVFCYREIRTQRYHKDSDVLKKEIKYFRQLLDELGKD